MAEKVLILGPSGSGKSMSIRTLPSEQTFVISPDRKTLPFRGSKNMYKKVFLENGKIDKNKTNYIETVSMSKIRTILKDINDNRPEIKFAIIDTITYAMIESVMNKIDEDNWDKYRLFAKEFYQLIEDIPDMRDDLTVFVLAHTEEESTFEGKTTQFKVPAGRFTKETLVPEGKFTIVLYSGIQMEKDKVIGYFKTQGPLSDTCKSPEGMFSELYIPNDLKYVSDCINAYYEDKEMPEAKEKIEIN